MKIKIKGSDGGHIKSKCAGYDTAVVCGVRMCAPLPVPARRSVIHPVFVWPSALCQMLLQLRWFFSVRGSILGRGSITLNCSVMFLLPACHNNGRCLKVNCVRFRVLNSLLTSVLFYTIEPEGKSKGEFRLPNMKV